LSNSADPKVNLDKMIEDILGFEDQINRILLTTEQESEENEKLLQNINKDIEKNLSRIDLLRQLVKSEETQREREIERRETEKKKISNILRDLEEEISNLRDGIDLTESLNIQEQKKIEEIKSVEKQLEEVKNKKNILNEDLKIQQIKSEELQVSVKKLKEDKIKFENDIVNSISLKETIEELINASNFKIIKYLQDSQDEYIYSETESEITLEEMSTIALPKFVSRLHENLLDLFFLNFSSTKSRDKERQLKIPKDDFENLMLKSLHNYVENRGLFNFDDLFILLTKKVFDLVVLHNKDEKSALNEINLEKLKIYLKSSLKIEFYEQSILNKELFLNRDYKLLKKEKERTLIELETKINSLYNKLEKIESQENDLKTKIQTIRNTSMTDNKLVTMLSLDEKLKSLIDMKNELNEELKNLEEKFSSRVKSYLEQIEEIEKINEILKKKKIECITKDEKIKLEKNEETLKLRNVIADKFREIKDYIKRISESGKEISDLYIDKINRILVNREIFQTEQASSLAESLREVQSSKLLNSNNIEENIEENLYQNDPLNLTMRKNFMEQKNFMNFMTSPPNKSKTSTVHHPTNYSHFIQPSYLTAQHSKDYTKSQERRNLSNFEFTDKEYIFLSSHKKENSISQFQLESNGKHKRDKSNITTLSEISSANTSKNNSQRSNQCNYSNVSFKKYPYNFVSPNKVQKPEKSRSKSKDKNLIKFDEKKELKNQILNLKNQINLNFSNIESENLKLVLEKVKNLLFN
jgi:hypothetical protein